MSKKLTVVWIEVAYFRDCYLWSQGYYTNP
jgi:hypothetical protein